MSEWKYIDSIAELSDFECAHCDTRDFYMVTYDTISQPWKVLNKFLKRIELQQNNVRLIRTRLFPY